MEYKCSKIGMLSALHQTVNRVHVEEKGCSHSKTQAAGSPLLTSRCQASMWDRVRPAWQS